MHNEQHRKLIESEKKLEDQKILLDRLKEEQDRARENAQRELHELKLRIQQEQMSEKQRLDEEMKRLIQLKEKHLQSAKVQEDNLAKHRVSNCFCRKIFLLLQKCCSFFFKINKVMVLLFVKQILDTTF